MSNGQKFKRIIFPYLIWSILIIGGYSLFRYWADLRLHLTDMHIETWEFWLPFFVVGPVTYGILNRIPGCRYKICLCGTLGITLTTIFLQSYLTGATQTLRTVESVCEIGQPGPNDCFVIRSWSVVPQMKVSLDQDYLFGSRGRAGRYQYRLYCAAPFSADTANCNVWVGKFYGLKSTRHSEKKKQEAYRVLNDSARQFLTQTGRNPASGYFRVVGRSAELDGFRQAIGDRNGQAVILERITKPFELRCGHRLLWAGICYSGFMLILCGIVLVTKFSGKNDDDFSDIVRGLLPVRGNPLWGAAVVANLALLLFFLSMLHGINPFFFSEQPRIEWAGFIPERVCAGEYWRLLTAPLMNLGLSFLVINLLFLYGVAFLLKPVFGQGAFIVLFLLSGVGAYAAMLVWHPVPDLGSCAGIYGLLGASLAAYLRTGCRRSLLLWVPLITGGGLMLFLGCLGNPIAVYTAATAIGFVAGCLAVNERNGYAGQRQRYRVTNN